VSALAFALNVPCVGLVYQHGGNIHAVNLVRPLFFLLCLGIWIGLRDSSILLPTRQRNSSYLLGLLICIEFYAVHSAIRYIPVGLSILLMYTYPIIVAIVVVSINRQRPAARMIAAIFVAFAGLVLALGAPTDGLDWRGIAWSALASVGMCAIVTISERTTAEHDNAAVMFHSMIIASLAMIAIVLIGAPITWPDDQTGLVALFAATGLYVIATSLLFVAVDMIGPLRFAVIDNTSPIWATLFGFILLAETLSWHQGLGAVLVIGGVITVQLLHPPAQATSVIH